MFSRILVSLDGSPLAEGILGYVRLLAPAVGAKVVLLRAIAPDPVIGLAHPSTERYLKRVAAAGGWWPPSW